MAQHNKRTLYELGISIAHIAIEMNGVAAERVIGFDEEEGFITRYKLDDQGRAVVEDGRYVEERVYGVVKAWLLWQSKPSSNGEPVAVWPHLVPAPRPGVRVLLRSVLQ